MGQESFRIDPLKVKDGLKLVHQRTELVEGGANIILIFNVCGRSVSTPFQQLFFDQVGQVLCIVLGLDQRALDAVGLGVGENMGKRGYHLLT